MTLAARAVSMTSRRHLDPVAAAKGASSGLTVLVVGGLLAPVLAHVVPAVARFALVAVALIAFCVAGRNIGSAETPSAQGAASALLSYTLVLPLVLMGARHLDLGQVSATVSLAVVVGALAGAFAGRSKGAAA